MESSSSSSPAINPLNSALNTTDASTNAHIATTISNSNDNNNSNNNVAHKTAGTDLKSSIIEFMRERPFLWNSKHPNYKDHKRREHEFQLFSNQIGCSVQEIKRVWHVLRTNFFRAHKLLLDRPQNSNGENGEKLWKYYLAMEYILDSSPNSKDSPVSKHIRSSRSSKEFHRNSSSSSSSGINTRLTAHQQKELNNNSRNSTGSKNNNHHNMSNSSLNSSSLNKSTSFSDSSFDDADHSYARSLTLSLKKFDPATREIIKLKFQEVIVNYIQLQQQQLQQPQQPEAMTQKPEPLPILKIDNK